MANPLETAKAKEEMFKSIRDLLTLTLKLPLGNPNLKLVHTNQFLFTEFPTDYFTTANMEILGQILNSNLSRFSGYQLNRWYIEEVTIDNQIDGDATMELKVNPFASSHVSYHNARNEFMKEYTNAFTKNNNATNNENKVKSVSNNNTSLKGGEGKFIDDLVKKLVGNETDALKKAKIIHKHLQGYLHYKGYTDSHYSSAEKAYKAKWVNCADTSRITASMMRSAGVTCYVVHSTCHYYTVIEYNGKLYCSDASSNYRDFNTYWKASSCGNGGTASFKGKSSFYAKCGKNPCS